MPSRRLIGGEKMSFVVEQWDEPGESRGFAASGWNRPQTLPRLDEKFDAVRAKREARERIKDALRKVSRVCGVLFLFFLFFFMLVLTHSVRKY